MRVLVVFGVSDLTGASRMGEYFVGAFKRANIPVFAVSPPHPGENFGGSESYASVISELEKSGVAVHVVPGLDQLASWSALRGLMAILSKWQITHVVSLHQNSLKYAAVAASLRGVVHISSRQGPIMMFGNSLTRAIKGAIFWACLRLGTKLCICTNDADAEQLRRSWKYPGQRVRVLSNGIDIQEFDLRLSRGSSRSLRESLGIGSEERMLVNVGRLDPQKDQLTLLKAFQKVSTQREALKLVLVGNVTAIGTASAEAYAERLRSFVKEAGLDKSVLFVGWRNDVPDLLAAADLYVHSAAWEGFPLAMCEALAARTAFIGTDCFGVPDGFVQGKHGWFVEKGNSDALANCIDKALALDDSELRAIGENGRALAEQRYDVKKIADNFVSLCMQV